MATDIIALTSPGTPHPGHPRPSQWRTCYRLGAIAAVAGVAGTVGDIVLTTLPGWGPDTVPADAAGWCAQLNATPWLGLRNLDLLNAMLVLVAVPTYLAVVIAGRHHRLGVSLIGFALILIGGVVFVANNAALPMLALSGGCPHPGAVLPTGLDGAIQAALARGAHGSYGALPGFLISEVGTAIVAGAMIGSPVFGRFTGWVGLVGAIGLTAYTLATTLTGTATTPALAVALAAGMAMLVFNLRVACSLNRLARRDPESHS